MHFFVPLAYDRIQNGQGQGSIARCNVLIEKAREIAKEVGTMSITFFSQAGYTKETPGRPSEKIREPLCDQMRNYVIGEIPWVCFYTTPQAWGTYEELRYTLQTAKSWNRNQKENSFYTSTNLGHSVRVWLCLFFLRSEFGMWRGWKMRVLIANHSFSKKEWFQETAKFFGYLYKFIFNRPFVN